MTSNTRTPGQIPSLDVPRTPVEVHLRPLTAPVCLPTEAQEFFWSASKNVCCLLAMLKNFESRGRDAKDLWTVLNEIRSCVHHECPICREALTEVQERTPPRSPDYPVEEVYELPDNTPRNGNGASSRDSGAGPSTSQQPSQQTRALISAQRPSSKRPDPPTAPGPMFDNIKKAARKDLESGRGQPTSFRPSTPFLKPYARGNTPNRQPVQADTNATTDKSGTPAGLTANDSTKQASGNVAWGVAEKERSKRSREEMSECPTDRHASKAARVQPGNPSTTWKPKYR